MNDKISLPRFAACFSEKSGISPQKAETFIKNFFEVIASTLAQGQEVNIKALGRFLPDGSFIPSKEFAETVNAPFAAFSAEEIAPDTTMEDLEKPLSEVPPIPSAQKREPEKITQPSPEAEKKPEDEEKVEIPVSVPEQNMADSQETLPETSTPSPVKEEETQEVNTEEPLREETQTAQPQETAPQEEEPEEYYFPPETKSGFGKGLVIGILIGLAVGVAVAYFLFDAFGFQTTQAPPNDSTTVVTSEQADPEASAATPPSSTSDSTEGLEVTEPIIDKIAEGYGLANMAAKYYGDKHFWVYIYQENKAKIPDPTKIAPGTELVIPVNAKYGINASDSASLAKAKQLENAYVKI